MNEQKRPQERFEVSKGQKQHLRLFLEECEDEVSILRQAIGYIYSFNYHVQEELNRLYDEVELYREKLRAANLENVSQESLLSEKDDEIKLLVSAA